MDTTYRFPTPSALMREKRPYLYSDSAVTNAYELGTSEFSHFLDTLTDRNQHKDFENFARRLCEREICPNLRPQTGPEGGGDGKIDADSYPVSSEVAERWLFGHANNGQDTWGLAVSATKRWSNKVRQDVSGLKETGRTYDRVFFVTSRPARSKDRLRIEKELSDQFGLPVTILDREWIIDKTLNNRHEDLAFEVLGAGRHDPERLQLGPNDIRRQRELDALEKSLANNANVQRERNRAIVDAFDAACLSRELEVPRYATEGRFQRAIRLAEKHGDTGQILRARYEHAWTSLWWFDDVSTINEEFEKIEELAFTSNLAEDASRICNLFQVLMGRCKQGWETEGELAIEPRSNRLRSHLETLAQNKSQPNNALHAEALIELHRLACLTSDTIETHSDIVWQNLSRIVADAKGMGEFPASMLDQVLEALSPFISESESFDELLMQLAEFMSLRQRDGKAGEIYLNRGRQKVENDDALDAIAWLGKASHCFMKEEYREEQFEALLLLSSAYRAVGLLWAARATCLASLVQIKALSAQAGEKRPELVPSVLMLARVSLELCRIPDFLFAVLWLRGLEQGLTLSEESSKHLAGELEDLDHLFSCLIAIVPQTVVSEMAGIPDALENTGMAFARMVLLFRLGYSKNLLKDGWLPNEAAVVELEKMVGMLTVQPAAYDFRKYEADAGSLPKTLSTTILGVDVSIPVLDQQCLQVGELFVASMEAFVATAQRCGAMPIAQKLTVSIELTEGIEKPAHQFDAECMHIAVNWPIGWSLEKVKTQAEVTSYLIEFCAVAFGSIATLAGKYDGFVKMLDDEMVLDRTVSFSNATLTHHRVFGSFALKLSDLGFLTQKTYPPLEPPSEPKGTPGKQDFRDGKQASKRHDNTKIHSVINTHLWDEAGWMGVVYASYDGNVPPIIAFGYKNGEMGKAIFRAWRDEFGDKDKNDEIHVSLLTGISAKEPLAYRAHITKSLNTIDGADDEGNSFWQLSRMQTMYPTSRENLDMFLREYERYGCFLLAPAEQGKDIETIIHTDLAILKRTIHMKEAWSVKPGDEAMSGILDDDDIFVPEGVDDAPYEKIREIRREMRRPA
ncbi:MAG: hypothetical protein ACRBBK_07340 [Paracoccaceae bacterium]